MTDALPAFSGSDKSPICDRHGTEKQPVSRRSLHEAKYRCRECRREADRRYDDKHPGRRTTRSNLLKAKGLCTQCGQDVAITETRCFDCANKLAENAIRYRL